MKDIPVLRIKLDYETPIYSNKEIKDAKDIVEEACRNLSTYNREVMMVLNLNAQGYITNANMVNMGGRIHKMAEPSDIFKVAIDSNAKSIIIYTIILTEIRHLNLKKLLCIKKWICLGIH